MKKYIGRALKKLTIDSLIFECGVEVYSSRTVGEKVHCREGNSPERELRFRIFY